MIKAKVDGVEIEAQNPKELAELLRELKQDKVKAPVTKKVQYRKKITGSKNQRTKQWNVLFEKAYQYLKDNEVSKSTALMHVNGYVAGGSLKAFRRYIRKKDKTKTKHEDGRTKFLRYIIARAAEIRKNNNISRTESFRVATKEWSSRKRQKEIAESGTPNILENDQNNKMLMQVLANVYKNDGRFVREKDSHSIGITSKEDWEDMILKIVNHQKEIMEYFGVKKPLVMKNEGSELVLFVG